MEPFLPSRRETCSGFSLIEVMIVTVLIALIACIAVPKIGNVRDRSREVKLESDVQTINNAIDVYVANGGNFARCKTPQAVVDTLKTVRDSETAMSFVGFTGSTIDHRLAARMAGSSDSGSDRAVWNATDQRFTIESQGTGVREFYLDESLAENDYGEEERARSVMDYNENPGWIWAYNDRMPAPTPGSSTFSVTPVAESPPPLAKATPSILSPPAITPGGGIFRSSEFPMMVTLTNPNDSSTWLIYSVNGSAFARYSAPFSVGADSSVRAYAAGDPSRWVNSSPVGALFQKSAPEVLATPSIRLSAPEFNDETSVITVSIANPNPPGISTLHYAVADPAAGFPPLSSWAPYPGTLSVNVTGYPAGFSVRAYAKPVDPLEYQNSREASQSAGANFIFDDPGVTDVLYIIDVSGSMNQAIGSSTRFKMVADALAEAIARLRPASRFSVTTFAETIKWADPSLQLKDASDANKKAMLDQISQFEANGSGTNYEAALRAPFIFGQNPKLVIFLTDGQPTSGSNYDDEIAALAAEGIQVNTIGVDLDDASKARLADIALKTKGKARNVKID